MIGHDLLERSIELIQACCIIDGEQHRADFQKSLRKLGFERSREDNHRLNPARDEFAAKQ